MALLCSAIVAGLYYGYHNGVTYVDLKQVFTYTQTASDSSKDHDDGASTNISDLAQLPELNNDDTVWPPVLFSRPTRFQKADVVTMKCLVSVVRAVRTENGSYCLAAYLESGASLGKYRQGGPLDGDSDIDIRIIRNYECNPDVYNTLPERVAKCKQTGSHVSLNSYEEWGDPVSNLTQKIKKKGTSYPRIGHSAMKAIVSSLTYSAIDSTDEVHFFIRKPECLLQDLRRKYGPAWFVPSPNHGIQSSEINHIKAYTNKKVRTFLCTDIDKYDGVHVDVVMHKLGVTSDGYARISPEERCSANKWFAWVARFCKGETQFPAQHD